MRILVLGGYGLIGSVVVRRLLEAGHAVTGLGRDTVFKRSKGQADAALQASGLDWTILRPGLAISAQAYGGTGLLRALSAMPFVLPMADPDRPIQTGHN